MPTNPLHLPLPVVADNLLPLLPNRDLAALRSVSRHAKALVEDELLWKRKVISDFTFPSHATARVGGWFNLYRGLSDPHVYVWGQTSNARLGIELDAIQGTMRADALEVNGGIPYPVRLNTIHSLSLQTHPQRRRLASSSHQEHLAGAVVQIVAGGWSFHARTSGGRVWYWGTMDGETWAGDHSSLRDPGKRCATPRLMDHVPLIQSLSGGRCHAVALTREHHILEWRAWGTVWKLEGFPSSVRVACHPNPSNQTQHDERATTYSNIKQLEAGWSFSTILTHSGEIWLWYSDWCTDAFQRSYYGAHQREAMMHADPPGHAAQKLLPLTINPVRLPPIVSEQDKDGSRVVQIAAGEDFIIALTEAGTIHKIDLHLPAPTGDDHRIIRQAQHMITDPDDRDLEALIHRLRITHFVHTKAAWHHLSTFERPEALSNFEASWRDTKRGPGIVGNISHISAHFRRFVAFLPIIPPESDQQDDETSQTLVLLGSASSTEPEMIPELQARGVIKVTMGDYHYGALTQSGEILTWGAFSKGALGNWIPPWAREESSSNETLGDTAGDEAGEGDERESGWLSNLIPLPQMLRNVGARQIRIGFAGRGGRAAAWNNSRLGRPPNPSEQVQSDDDVDTPTPIHIRPPPDTQRTRGTPFAFDVAFAGWHSSALVMHAPTPSSHQ